MYTKLSYAGTHKLYVYIVETVTYYCPILLHEILVSDDTT